MKKNTIKAFTLVEMLIVIVIIGILIASLMPRMQTAQGRARDVARKNDLSQIQTAIITSQQDRGAYPWMTNNGARTEQNWTETTNANSGMIVDDMAYNLQIAGMSSVPSDPNGSNRNFWLWSSFDYSIRETWSWDWKYLYLVAKRNWVANAWFVLIAKTEVEWWSNWVVCDSGSSSDLGSGYILSTNDLAKITTCKRFTKGDSCQSNQDDCLYQQEWQLRYILLY